MADGHRETYTHGHHQSVLRSHEWRTAENSAAYLLPELHAGDTLLDVGCGPGTITIDLAARVAPGRVTGIDRAAEVVEHAAAAGAAQGASNVSFEVGDVYHLAFDDASFDVVHAHQVLQHLRDPVAALREMRRVLRPGGLLAVRDGDYGAFIWSPADPMLDRWNALYHDITARNGAEADAGRYLFGWAHAAGFESVRASTSAWTFADDESRGWWSETWAERVEASAFAKQAIEYGLTDTAELAAIAAAWRTWATHPDAFYAVIHVEVLARR
jgi:ubiquinone/menaquinone biosynthesis C-methylase UbiE